MAERDATTPESMSPEPVFGDAVSSEEMSREEREEQQRIDVALEKEGRKSAPMSAGCFLRGALIATLLTIVACGLGGLGYRSWLARLAAKRDAILAEIRASGDPLTSEEM